ncbi:MAG TPA: sigma 54-interacting transcriptional regulator [bacterium]|nr:sigma 54-interacting transcriptional regulator [bacterium]
MPYKIGIVVPYPELGWLCRQVSTAFGDTIMIYDGAFNNGVQRALQAEKEGAEVIISRGATAASIREHVSVPVVDILTDDGDLVKALYKARQWGHELAVVTSRHLLLQKDLLEHLLDARLRQFIFSAKDHLPQVVFDAKNEGCQVIIGGIYTIYLAEQTGLKAVLIRHGQEAVIRAISEARSIARVRRQERYKTQYVWTIMEFAQEGILAIDDTLAVTVYNKAAENIFGLKANGVIGEPVTNVIPNTRLHHVLRTGCPELGMIQRVRGDTFIATNRVPIEIEGKIVGAVATFKDITQLQEAEHKIRQKLQAKGHIAKYALNDIVGSSESLLKTKEIAIRCARTESTILMTGESGTGKEMFAQGIHNLSRRRNGPFVAVNCAALPGNLLESELFGFEEGAFTGARKGGKRGLFWLAHRGSIFLDEIGSLPAIMQARLLRVLQEKEITPLGSNKVIPVDVRVIAASNSDLRAAVERKEFRADLFYRLSTLVFSIPPLRARKGDIILLARHFLGKLWPENNDISISRAASDAMLHYSWPGNIRELENIMERIAVFAAGKREIKLRHVKKAMADTYLSPMSDLSIEIELKGTLQDIRQQIIRKALTKVSGNKTLAAKKLRISRTQLWRATN